MIVEQPLVVSVGAEMAALVFQLTAMR